MKFIQAAAFAAILGFAGAASAQTTEPAAPAHQAAPSSYSDAQLQSFAAASLEIDPISRTLATATPEQRTEAATQIREILTRHQLDSATYNQIASSAQSDPALAARVAELQTAGADPHADAHAAESTAGAN